MRISWKQVVVSFLVGLLLGAAGGMHGERLRFNRFWQHGPNAERQLAKFSSQLDLNARQQAEVKAILDSQRDKMMTLHQEMLDKFQEIRLSMRTEIAKILTDDQQKKFTQLTARWDTRHTKTTK